MVIKKKSSDRPAIKICKGISSKSGDEYYALARTDGRGQFLFMDIEQESHVKFLNILIKKFGIEVQEIKPKAKKEEGSAIPNHL